MKIPASFPVAQTLLFLAQAAESTASRVQSLAPDLVELLQQAPLHHHCCKISGMYSSGMYPHLGGYIQQPDHQQATDLEIFSRYPTRSVFVRDLPYFCTSQELGKFFAEKLNVPILHAVVCKNKKRRTLQFGCVLFEREEHVGLALQYINGQRLIGRDIRVLPYDPGAPLEPSTTGLIHVSFKALSPHCPLITETVLRECFEAYGPIDHVSIRSHKFSEVGHQGGYGFLTFRLPDQNRRVVDQVRQLVLHEILFDCSWSESHTQKVLGAEGAADYRLQETQMLGGRPTTRAAARAYAALQEGGYMSHPSTLSHAHSDPLPYSSYAAPSVGGGHYLGGAPQRGYHSHPYDPHPYDPRVYDRDREERERREAYYRSTSGASDPRYLRGAPPPPRDHYLGGGGDPRYDPRGLDPRGDPRGVDPYLGRPTPSHPSDPLYPSPRYDPYTSSAPPRPYDPYATPSAPPRSFERERDEYYPYATSAPPRPLGDYPDSRLKYPEAQMPRPPYSDSYADSRYPGSGYGYLDREREREREREKEMGRDVFGTSLLRPLGGVLDELDAVSLSAAPPRGTSASSSMFSATPSGVFDVNTSSVVPTFSLSLSGPAPASTSVSTSGVLSADASSFVPSSALTSSALTSSESLSIRPEGLLLNVRKYEALETVQTTALTHQTQTLSPGDNTTDGAVFKGQGQGQGQGNILDTQPESYHLDPTPDVLLTDNQDDVRVNNNHHHHDQLTKMFDSSLSIEDDKVKRDVVKGSPLKDREREKTEEDKLDALIDH